MDGRVQVPVISFMQKRFDAPYVDSITEPGPNFILAEQRDFSLLQSIDSRLKISVEKHKSEAIAIVGHHDCAGNPTSEDEQKIQVRKSKAILEYRYPELPIYGLWLDENFDVHEVG